MRKIKIANTHFQDWVAKRQQWVSLNVPENKKNWIHDIAGFKVRWQKNEISIFLNEENADKILIPDLSFQVTN